MGSLIVSPMPLGRRREPFDATGWIYELKLDGFRALAHLDRGRVVLVSRNGIRYRRFDELAAAIAAALPRARAVLDGELVCLAGDGRSDFDALFYRRSHPYFYAFDLLALDGRDLRNDPLLERKRRLRALLGRRSDRVRYLTHVRGRGMALYRRVCDEDLEGIVAKRADSPYAIDSTPVWLKIKNPAYSQGRGRWERFERARR